MRADVRPIFWPPSTALSNPGKFTQDAWAYWDQFYKQHQDKFFKDRHYLGRECPDLQSGPKIILEVGCGVGNTVYPVLARNEGAFFHACDFSPEAVACLKRHPEYSSDKVNAFVCDISKESLAAHIQPGTVDICTMIFVLSAIDPALMVQAVRNVANVLKSGGRVFIRDYAAGDLAEVLLDRSQATRKLQEHFYVRGDGTCSFYFSKENLASIFGRAQLTTETLIVHEKEVENHAQESMMSRKWIQGSFLKSSGPSSKQPEGPCITEPTLACMEEKASKSDKTLIISEAETSNEWEDSQHHDEDQDCVADLFGGVDIVEEVEETFNVKGYGRVTVRSVSREHRHTLAHTGLMVWDAGPFFASYLAQQQQLLSGKNVLELGCGANPLCILACLRHAARVLSTDGSHKALLKMAENLGLNCSQVVIERARLRELAWGNENHVQAIKADYTCGFDVVVGADVVYVEEHVPTLFQTARKLISASHKAILLLCHLTRRVSEGRICEHAAQAGFTQTEAPLATQLPAVLRLLCFKVAEPH